MRITGGEYRSRPLKAPKGTTTRPTSDRVREAVFSILGAATPRGAAVLDLYAGTGALGLEALSRGARLAVFVERSKEALAALEANVRSLGLRSEGRSTDEARVLAVPVERCARALGDQHFDLVFADPPYADVASGVAVRALEACAVPRMCASGLLVLEHASRDPPPVIAPLVHEDARTYGDTTVSFYRAPS